MLEVSHDHTAHTQYANCGNDQCGDSRIKILGRTEYTCPVALQHGCSMPVYIALCYGMG